jgi:hypothetical protein
MAEESKLIELFNQFRAERYPDGFPANVNKRAIRREFDRWARKCRPEQLKQAMDEEADKIVELGFNYLVERGHLKSTMRVRPNGTLYRVFIRADVEGTDMRSGTPEGN